MDDRRELSGVVVFLVISAIGGAILVGLWLGFWEAMIVTAGFALIGIAAVIWWSVRRTHPPAGEAPHVQPVEDGVYRILIVADERCATPDVIDELSSHAGGRPISIFVMAPALESRLGRLAGDQHGYDDASRRLKETLEALEEAGLAAQGEIGANDPLQAIDDGLRQFPANEILFVTHPEGETNWLESGVVELAQTRYEQPVNHIAVTAA